MTTLFEAIAIERTERRLLELEKAAAVAYLDVLPEGKKWDELAERVTKAEDAGLHYRLARVKHDDGHVSADIEIMENGNA